MSCIILAAFLFTACSKQPAAPPPPAKKKQTSAQTKSRPLPARCKLSLAGKGPFKVYAVGIYAGLEPLQDNDAAKPATEAEVMVTEEDAPVVLVLMAHDATLWRVGRTKKANIAGVLVGGYNRGSVSGLPKDVPLLITSHQKKKGMANCPNFYAHEAGPRLLHANNRIKKYTGREIDHFVFQAQDGIFYAGPPEPQQAAIFGEDLQREPKAAPARRAAKISGLAGLEQEGAVKLAGAEEIAAWEKGASDKYARFNPQLKVPHKMIQGETYVLLRNTRLPKLPKKETSFSFIVPRGVKVPRGGGGTNRFYLMNGFKCVTGRGADCE